jgi:hypothetical protein
MPWMMWCLVRSAPAAVPSPDFDRVDHDDLRAALRLPRTLGSRQLIRDVAREIQGATIEQKLASISAWMNDHLVLDATAAYHWRDVETVLDEGRYGGCADQALVFGAIARASGIPVVWVKTMDIEWIQAFVMGPEPDVWSGHVFLEVWTGAEWDLYDVAEARLWDDYNTATREFPGRRYGYDKGVDPYELVLSTRWLEWKEQTRAYFRSFDAQVYRDLPHRGAVVVAGDNPGYDQAYARMYWAGYDPSLGGNAAFDEWMPAAVGHTLVVLSLGGRDVLPEPYRSRYVGGSFADRIAQKRPGTPWWVDQHEAEDSTTVWLVYGATAQDLEKAISTLAGGGW